MGIFVDVTNIFSTTLLRYDWNTKQYIHGISVAVQWLRLHASIAGGMGWIPGQGTRIPHATQRGQKKTPKPPNKQKTNKTSAFLMYIIWWICR